MKIVQKDTQVIHKNFRIWTCEHVRILMTLEVIHASRLKNKNENAHRYTVRGGKIEKEIQRWREWVRKRVWEREIEKEKREKYENFEVI